MFLSILNLIVYDFIIIFFILSDCYLFITKVWLRTFILEDSEWTLAYNAISKKKEKIFKNIRILSYFFVSMVFLGAAGVWLPWLKEGVYIDSYFRGDNIFTFALAVLGGLLCNKIFHADKVIKDIFKQLNFSFTSKDNHTSNELRLIMFDKSAEYKEQIALTAIGLFFGSISLICIIYAYATSDTKTSFVGVFGLLLALILYLFSTADEIDENTKVPELTNEIPEPAILDSKVGDEPHKLFRDK